MNEYRNEKEDEALRAHPEFESALILAYEGLLTRMVATKFSGDSERLLEKFRVCDSLEDYKKFAEELGVMADFDPEPAALATMRQWLKDKTISL